MKKGKEHFENVLAEFGEITGLGKTALGADGSCTVTFDEAIEIHLTWIPEAGAVVTHAHICSVDGLRDTDELLESLLRANFFWDESKGFTFALDGEKILVADRRVAEWFIDGEHLQFYLESCSDLVKQWRMRIIERVIA